MHFSIVLMSVLRVLWMSTHGCFAILFPHTRLLRSDDGVPESADPADDYYYPNGAYYYVESDDQE